MGDSVRHVWVLSLGHSSIVHQVMMTLSGLYLKSSEKHIDMGESRHKRDYEDYVIFTDWIEQRNPFTFVDEHLHSLTSAWVSISGKDLVTCERSEEIGANIPKALDGQNLETATVNRKTYIRPLYTVVKIDKEQVHVNPIILLTRITAIARWEVDVDKYLSFKMMTYPPSLFKDGLMRRADKAALRRALLSDDEAVGKDQIDENLYVVDWGALLHRGRWLKDSTFNALTQLYIRKHYSSAHVIFGGYKYASTKSNDELLIKSLQIFLSILYQLHKIVFFRMTKLKLLI